MSFDCSRFTFDPWNDYLGVVLQQGRVQLDADWNEWMAELARRLQAGTADILGTSAVPRATTPDGFKIAVSSSAGKYIITIGRGRIYVDGLLAENHGFPAPSPLKWTDGTQTATAPSLNWNTVLNELSGTGDTPYDNQPYYPNPTALPVSAGPHVVYIDVWRRELTYLQQPDLVEKAVGVDTAERIQTVWQVKILPDTGTGTSCSTDLAGLLLAAKIYPSGSRLTTGAVAIASPTDPCQVPTSSGYKGLENQLYRVEIHQNSAGTSKASFKWSRDNATVATLVTQITAPDTLVVQSVGKDDVLRFNPLDWVEIIDDSQELNGQPGEIHQIKDVQDATLTITLQTPLTTPSKYPVDGQGNTNATRHTRIRRWDQKGKIFQSDGQTVYWDLDNPADNSVPAGTIPVPAPGTVVILENGVTVSFNLDSKIPQGIFQTMDYWAFAARSTDGTVEKLTQAPPRGIHHHYTKLAVVTFPGDPLDCRTLWPALPIGGGGSGCCTVTIGPSDLTGSVTLQNVLDQYQGKTNTVICLKPGDYSLTQPLRLATAHSGLTMKGCDGGVAVRVTQGSEPHFQDGMVILDNVNNFTLSNIRFFVPEVPFTPVSAKYAGLPMASLDPDVQTIVKGLYVSIGVRSVNSLSVTISKCTFDFGDFEEDLAGKTAFGAGIFGNGQSDGLTLEGNEFAGIGPFLAGYVLTSSVAFNPPSSKPPIRPIGPIERAPAAIRTQPAATLERMSATPVASSTGADKVPQFIRMMPNAMNAVSSNATLFEAANILQKIGSLTLAAKNLAAYGGSVLPACLDQAVIRDNNFSGMNAAVLILAETGEVTITGNKADYGDAGIWVLEPQQGSLLAMDPLSLLGGVIALGYPLPQGDTSKPAVIAAAAAPIRIYSGKTSFTDSQGNAWIPDAVAKAVVISGGSLNQPANPKPITGAVPGDADQVLYQSERYGAFTYTLNNLPNAYYQVTLKFAEIFWAAAGKRLFNVAINGTAVLTGFDVFADAGGPNIADDQVFRNIVPVNGQIVIQFSGTVGSPDQNAKIAAVEVLSQQYANTTSLNEAANFFIQEKVLENQAFVNPLTAPLHVRLEHNTLDQMNTAAVFVAGFPRSSEQSNLIMSGNLLRRIRGAQKEGYLRLNAAANISGVSIATVTGNQILHTADGYSLILYDPDQSPGVAVTGNVFQGNASLPQRDLPASVPSPMNAWVFLNTVIR